MARRICTTLHENGRLFCIESNAPTGRYPKLWDQQCIQDLRQKTGAKIIPGSIPGALWFLARGCPGVGPTHQHVPLKGASPIPSVPLTRLAQQYAPSLCGAWGLVIRAAFEQCWTDLGAPPWPTDSAKSTERTLGATTGPIGSEHHLHPCQGCRLQQNKAGHAPLPVL